MINSFVEQKRFVRDIRGAAASILWILLMSGRSLTNIDLEDATGYSDKPINQGTARLQEYGLIQDNGIAGWSIANVTQLPLPFRELWQGFHGKHLMDNNAQTGPTQESVWSYANGAAAGSQDTLPSELSTELSTGHGDNVPKTAAEIGISDPLINVVVVDQELINKQQQQQTAIGNSDLDLVTVLRKIGVKGRAFHDLLQRQADPACVLGWHWWTMAQGWSRNPVGYVIARLNERQAPPDGYVELVRWWYALDGDSQELVRCHLSGWQDGQYLHAKPEDAAGMDYWLDGEVTLPSETAVSALIALSARKQQP